jgi:hypothetical protein
VSPALCRVVAVAVNATDGAASQPQTAPSAAELTSLRYLASTPLVYLGGSGSHPTLRAAGVT